MDYSTYATYLNGKGKTLGEVRKNESDRIMNAMFQGDVGYRKVYILDPEQGWHYTDAKFSKHAASSIAKDSVDSYLQFRPKEHHPIGTYVFIPDDTDFELGDMPEDPIAPTSDVSKLWMICDVTSSNQFVKYLVLKINYNFKWVHGSAHKRTVLNCWGCARNANSYTSGVWTDNYTTSLDNLTSAWLPNTYYIFGNDIDTYNLTDTRTLTLQERMMITHNKINPNCYMISKVLDMSPSGIIKLSLKQDDYDPKRDDVENLVCDYYVDTGDVNVIDPNPTPVSGTSTINYMAVNADGELEEGTMIESMTVGKTYYFAASFTDDDGTENFDVDADWRITLIDPTSDEESEELEKLITIRHVNAHTISIRPAKSLKTVGRKFELSVSDADGNYRSSVSLEVDKA